MNALDDPTDADHDPCPVLLKYAYAPTAAAAATASVARRARPFLLLMNPFISYLLPVRAGTFAVPRRHPVARPDSCVRRTARDLLSVSARLTTHTSGTDARLW